MLLPPETGNRTTADQTCGAGCWFRGSDPTDNHEPRCRKVAGLFANAGEARKGLGGMASDGWDMLSGVGKMSGRGIPKADFSGRKGDVQIYEFTS